MPFVRVVRVVACAVALTFSWSMWVACADAAIGSTSAMACCKDGELACAPQGGADCCKTVPSRSRDAVAGARMDPTHAPHAILTQAVRPEVATVQSTHAWTPASISPHPISSGPPPYIAFSSLLI